MADADEPVPGTGTLTYRIDGGEPVTVPMEEERPNEYRATLPRVACPLRVEYWFGVESAGSGLVTDPPDAPATVHEALSVAAFDVLLEDDFEEDLGWRVQSQNLDHGEWERAVPAGSSFQGDPRFDADGSGQCYLTENGTVNADVDGGPTDLVTPKLDYYGKDGLVRYAYWMYCSTGEDALRVEIRSTPISSWTLAKLYAGGGGGWIEDSLVVSDHVNGTNQVEVRFRIADQPDNSVTEAAIDAFRADHFDCEPATGFEISMSPLVRGAGVEFRAEGAVPGTKVVFLRSRHGIGPGPCSSGLGELCIDLVGPVVRTGVAHADASGVATLTLRCPSGAPLIPYHVQAVNRVGEGGGDSTKSNLLTDTVREAP
jgi:hypothetical protein